MNQGKKYWLGLALVLGLAGIYYGSQTPTFAVYRITKAIQDQDPATFREYVNVEKTVGAALDDIKALDLEKSSRQDSLMGMIGAQLQGSLLDIVQAPIVALVNRELDAYITRTKITPIGSSTRTSDAFGELTRLRALMVDPAKGRIVYLKRDGPVANVGVQVHNGSLQKTFLLNFTMEQGKRWQVVRLSNLLFILSEIIKGEKDLLKRHNLDVRSQISQFISIGPLQKEDKDYGWGLVKTTVLSIPVRNMGQVPIQSFNVVVSRKKEGSDATADILFSLEHDEVLAPGASLILKSDTNIGVWGGQEKIVTEAVVAELQAEITRLTLADGRTLAPVETISEIGQAEKPGS
ncbi:DUF2939 domain-containing protein [Oligoflexus sp.]|uniref:DUF2939 domain-containing protein n=1 Tax=Oligoflexus sp. TaxID=1971216 RepID=UPI002D79A7AF|nr:hypothetical protein [Oligoflexus sp.]